MDDDSIEDYKKITDFTRTFVKDEKLYDYYSKEEWSSDSLVEKTKNVLLFVTIKKPFPSAGISPESSRFIGQRYVVYLPWNETAVIPERR